MISEQMKKEFCRLSTEASVDLMTNAKKVEAETSDPNFLMGLLSTGLIVDKFKKDLQNLMKQETARMEDMEAKNGTPN